MRVRITTPNVLKALRKRSSEVAKPYNFALSPILIQPSPDCTLVAPASKHPEEWLTQGYTEIHSGDVVKLGSEYNGKTLTPQTLSRHCSSAAKAFLVPHGSLEDEIVSNHSNVLLPECGAFVTDTLHFRVGARQSRLSALTPVAE